MESFERPFDPEIHAGAARDSLQIFFVCLEWRSVRHSQAYCAEPREIEGRKTSRTRNKPHDKLERRRIIMSSEFTPLMGTTTFDHDVSRIVVGDPESLRESLTSAMEQLGYRVINENPIQARRSAQGSAKSGCSQNILN